VDSPAPAYVTVTDAAGRVLFRRAATQAEIEEAIAVAQAADAEAEAALKRIAGRRTQVLPTPAPPAAEEEAAEDEEAAEEEAAPVAFAAEPESDEFPAFDESAFGDFEEFK